MLRFGSVLALIVGALAFKPATEPLPSGDPPSSLDPAPKGKVRLSHERLRAVACAFAREKDRPVCRAQRAQIDSLTTLVLHPIGKVHIGRPKDKRQRVTVVFGSRIGRQEQIVELGAGEWEVEWDGYGKRPRFRVVASDEFEIKLSTLKGACSKSSQECVLDASVTSKDCAIPETQRPRR
jgi:hypothetical protein